MDLMQGRFGYIDPGTYTLGWVAISDGMYESVISDGRQVGLKKLGEHVQKYLSETYQWSPRSQADILAALTKGKLEVFDKGKLIEIDLYEVSRQFINKIYGEVLNEIDKTWKGARDRRVYVGSGGGRYILELVQEKFPHAVLLSSTAKQRKSLADGYYDFIPNQSDVFDVVHGYLLYGLDQLETELEKANNENKELVA